MQCTGGNDVIVVWLVGSLTSLLIINIAHHHCHEDVCAYALGKVLGSVKRMSHH